MTDSSAARVPLSSVNVLEDVSLHYPSALKSSEEGFVEDHVAKRENTTMIETIQRPV